MTTRPRNDENDFCKYCHADFYGAGLQINLFVIMAHKGALVIAIVAVAIIFIAAVKILGNPLSRKEGDHDKDK